jgi:ABC-type oligopeptide transport system substrate-binding subunit
MKTIVKTVSMAVLCLLLSMAACNSKKSETTGSDTSSMGTTPDGNMGSMPADSTAMDSVNKDSLM